MRSGATNTGPHKVKTCGIRANPADGCELPRVEQKEIQPLSEEQLPLFPDAIEGHCHEYIYKVALFTGMREGEVLGLMWDCVDFSRGAITVKRQPDAAVHRGHQAEKQRCLRSVSRDTSRLTSLTR